MKTNLVDLEYLCEPSLEPPEPCLCCGEVAPQTSYLTVFVLNLARVVVRVVCWKFCLFKFVSFSTCAASSVWLGHWCLRRDPSLEGAALELVLAALEEEGSMLEEESCWTEVEAAWAGLLLSSLLPSSVL